MSDSITLVPAGMEPTVAQRDVKSAFWVAFTDTPFADPANITCELAVQLTGEAQLSKWWKQPGFKRWFLNQNEFAIKLETGRQKAIDVLYDLMANPDVSAAVRAQAAKTILDEYKQNAKKQIAEEGDLSPEQVQEIIKTYAPKLIGGGS